MMMSFVIGVVTSAVSALLLRAWARKRKVVRKVGTPTAGTDRDLPPVGGVALALGCLAGALSWSQQVGLTSIGEQSWFLGAVAVVLVVGLIDDFVRELKPWQKLLGQGVACVMLIRGGIMTQMVMLSPFMNVVVTVLWVIAIINAVNLLDIADGLAVGTGLIAAGTFLILSLLTGQAPVAGLLAVLCGALLGVFLFNFPRATLFLGDSGSMLLGLLLAALALVVSYAPLGRESALLTPILVLGLPIYDLAFVTVVRVRNGRSVFKKSEDHFVFRLMRQGWSATKAVFAMFGLCLAFSLTAVVISRASNPIGIVTMGIVAVGALWWAVRISRVPGH